MLKPGTRMGKNGKYVVRRKLGQGGMAEVYLCSSRGEVGFEKNVAIKRIRPEWAEDVEFVGMFIKEAHLAANLDHHNVVHIHDFDQHDGAQFYVMEYVHGRSLSEVIGRSRELIVPIPHLLVAQIGDAVALGLDAAHRAQGKRAEPLKIVHRDVSPQNVLLSFNGVVKLTDFGVAKSRFTNTTSGPPKGKANYMSPEQARGQVVDARTDLFALGIVLWEMLFRTRLFDGDSDEAVKRAVESSSIPVPARINPDIPEELSALVMKSLERDPGLRFQTAAEMHRALKGFIARHAATEEVELTGYLQQLFGEVIAEEAERDRSLIESSSPGPDPETSPSQPVTRSMKNGDADTDPASPDEDMHAETQALDGAPPSQTSAGSMEGALQQLVQGHLQPEPASRARASGPRPAPVTAVGVEAPAAPSPPGKTTGARRATLAAVVLGLILAAAGVISANGRDGHQPMVAVPDASIDDGLPASAQEVDASGPAPSPDGPDAPPTEVGSRVEAGGAVEADGAGASAGVEATGAAASGASPKKHKGKVSTSEKPPPPQGPIQIWAEPGTEIEDNGRRIARVGDTGLVDDQGRPLDHVAIPPGNHHIVLRKDGRVVDQFKLQRRNTESLKINIRRPR